MSAYVSTGLAALQSPQIPYSCGKLVVDSVHQRKDYYSSDVCGKINEVSESSHRGQKKKVEVKEVAEDLYELYRSIPEKCFFPELPPALEDELNPDKWDKIKELLRLYPHPQERQLMIDLAPFDKAMRDFERLSRSKESLSEVRAGLRGYDDTGYPLKEGGKPFDVVSLLSHHHQPKAKKGAFLIHKDENGSNVTNIRVTVEEALRGKRYVLVCCFCVPTLWNSGCIARVISNATSELKSLYGDDFIVTVVVAHMVVTTTTGNVDDNNYAFDRFFAAFPDCLAVPFDDEHRRNIICTTLNFDKSKLLAKGILIDNKSHEVVLYDKVENCFVVDGAAAIPSTDLHSKLVPLRPRRGLPYQNPLSLDLLLCPTTSTSSNNCFLVRKSGARIPVSELRNKFVGLYLYSKAYDSMDDVVKAYQCGKKHHQEGGVGFEVVLIPMPLSTGENLKIFEHYLNRALEVHKSTTDEWFISPLKDSTIRVLTRYFGTGRDILFILHPEGKLVDRHGLKVIKAFGVQDTSFPFTRDQIIQTQLSKLKEQTFVSLFSTALLHRSDDPSHRHIAYSEDGDDDDDDDGLVNLNSGVVFVCLCKEVEGSKQLDHLRDVIQQLKRDAPPGIEFQLVLVLWQIIPEDKIASILCDQECCLVCPEPPLALTQLASEMLFPSPVELLSFLDGNICSIDISGVGAVLKPPKSHDQHLRQEIINRMPKSNDGYGFSFMNVDKYPSEPLNFYG